MLFLLLFMEAGSNDRPPMLAPVSSETTRQSDVVLMHMKCGKLWKGETKSESIMLQIATVLPETEEKKLLLFCSIMIQNLLRLLKMRKLSKDKEIDKLMALIFSLVEEILPNLPTITFEFINTPCRANQDNFSKNQQRIWVDNQRVVNVARV
ncbi:hypothetical protein Tco_0940413 [Tanacetum coccineum]|uniref:Uncharacterized protein n=1 Tax=Tanacetum coccineum TaxID=301880 RepID=A0ABQ5DPP1_9ASTR